MLWSCTKTWNHQHSNGCWDFDTVILLLMWTSNSRGPSTELCGTPLLKKGSCMTNKAVKARHLGLYLAHPTGYCLV